MTVTGGQTPHAPAQVLSVPGDPSTSAVWAAAAAALPGSLVRLTGVGLNPHRHRNCSASWRGGSPGSPMSAWTICRNYRTATAMTGSPQVSDMSASSAQLHCLPVLRTVSSRGGVLEPATTRAAASVPGSSFFILSNDLSEILRGGQTCCSDVVVLGDTRMPMVQKCAGEMRVLTAVGRGARRGTAAKQVRAYCHPYRCEGRITDHLSEGTTILDPCSAVAAEPESRT